MNLAQLKRMFQHCAEHIFSHRRGVTTGIAKAQAFGQKSGVEPICADPGLQQNFEVWRGHQSAEITRRQNEVSTHHRRFAIGQNCVTRRCVIIARPACHLPIIIFIGKVLLDNGDEFDSHFAKNGHFFAHARFSISASANSVTLL